MHAGDQTALRSTARCDASWETLEKLRHRTGAGLLRWDPVDRRLIECALCAGSVRSASIEMPVPDRVSALSAGVDMSTLPVLGAVKLPRLLVVTASWVRR